MDDVRIMCRCGCWTMCPSGVSVGRGCPFTYPLQRATAPDHLPGLRNVPCFGGFLDALSPSVFQCVGSPHVSVRAWTLLCIFVRNPSSLWTPHISAKYIAGFNPTDRFHFFTWCIQFHMDWLLVDFRNFPPFYGPFTDKIHHSPPDIWWGNQLFWAARNIFLT